MAEDRRGGGAGRVNDSDGGGAPDLGVEGEGLREPEGVGVVFVVVAKLLTLSKDTKREGLAQTHAAAENVKRKDQIS